jgi:hypothetical protein
VVAISSPLLILIPVDHGNTANPPNISLGGPEKCLAPYNTYTKARRLPMISLMSLISWLPNELIIQIAVLLDAPSLVHFESVRPSLLLFPLLYYPANIMLDL